MPLEAVLRRTASSIKPTASTLNLDAPTPTPPKPRIGSMPSMRSSNPTAPSAPATCSPSCRWRPTGTASAPRPGQHAVHQHHPGRGRAALPRQPRDRTAHQEPGPLERDGDGRPRQQARRHASAATSRPSPRRRRSTRSASTTSSAAPTAPAAATWSTSRATPRPASTPAPSSKAGSTEQQLENFRRELAAGRRPVVVSAPLADAGLLAVPHRVDGPRRRSWPSTRPASTATCEHRGLKDTAGQHVWCFLGDGETDEPESLGATDAGLAREARQPHLRRQLQPAAARRPGARQRQDHPGTGSRLPRRRLERHQGHLGQRLGPAAGRATRAACSSSAWARSSTANIRNTPSSRGAYIREHFFGKYPELLEAGRAPLRRAAGAS